MRTTVKGKNLDVLDSDRRYAEQKMQRLSRLLDDRSEVIVEFSVEHNKSADQTHIAELTLLLDGKPVRGVARAATFRAAIDVAVDKVEELTVEHKERPRTRARSDQAKEIQRSMAVGPTESEDHDGHRLVVKVKRFAIQPMFEEDAVAQMEELGHSFFLFVNAENERVALLYRRRDGDYGMIEPTIGGAYTPGRK
ncbi:MAG: ribosome-associated translation inhibitor RaiA [Chloroflexi bacterium]|nr:ribosome-associated translation inhibitor RaiA [Chloroflexota bacterium]